MASETSASIRGKRKAYDPTELRIVLIGGRREDMSSGKSSVGNIILGRDVFDTNRRTVHNVVRQEEVSGRQVTVVDTPGWMSHNPLDLTPKRTQLAIQQSVYLCPPGPHAFVQVMPLDTTYVGTDILTEEHVSLLFSDRVWKYTIMVFTVAEENQMRPVKDLIRSNYNLRYLAKKCEDRFHVINITDRGDGSQVSELLEKIDQMVTSNGGHYDTEENVSEEQILPAVRRRNSMEYFPPSMSGGTPSESGSYYCRSPDKVYDWMKRHPGSMVSSSGYDTMSEVPSQAEPEVMRLEQELNRLKAELEIKDMQLQHKDKTLREMRKLERNQQVFKEVLNETLRAKEVEESKILSENEALIEKLKAEEVERRRIVSEKEAVFEQLEAEGKEKHQLKQKWESLKVELETKNIQLHQREKRLIEVQEENKNHKDKNAVLSKQLSSEQSMLQQSKLKESELNKQLSSILSQKEALTERLKAEEADKQQVQEENKNHKDKNAVLSKQLSSEQAMLQQSKLKESELNKQLSSILSQKEALTERLKAEEIYKQQVQQENKNYKDKNALSKVIQNLKEADMSANSRCNIGDEALIRNDDEVRIVMVGKTGAGKSATGNTILGLKAFESKFSHESLTKRCKKVRGVVAGRKVAVVDTPGFFDTRFSEDQTQCIRFAAPGPHVFLVVIRLGRFTDEEKKYVEMIQKAFGEMSNNYTMILLTGADQLEGESLEDMLETSPTLKDIIRTCDDRYHVFNNKDNDPDQVTELLRKINTMVLKNGGSHYTSEMLQEAEKAIEEEKQKLLRENEEQRRQEIEDLKKRFEREALEEETKKLKAKCKR